MDLKKVSWIWHDPVWSKVISTGLLFLFGSVAYFFGDRIALLNGSAQVPNSVLLTVIVVFISGLSWFLWRLITSVKKKLSANHAQSLEPLFDIECVAVHKRPIYYKYGVVRNYAIPTGNFLSPEFDYALTGQFHLKAKPGASRLSLKSVVEITHTSDDQDRFINEGVWLDGETPYVSIHPGGFVELVLCVYRNETLFLCERDYIKDDTAILRHLRGPKVSIRVELIGYRNNDVDFTQSFRFSVDTEDDFRLSFESETK